jgi:hypothetical protein
MAGMKGRRFRFSLRTLLLLLTVLCVWLGVQVTAARRQKNAVEAILSAGGRVVYDYQVVARPPMPAVPGAPQLPAGAVLGDTKVDHRQLPPGPAWLRKQIGDDYFATVVAAYFNHAKATIQKPDLDQLARVPHVRKLGFYDCDTRIHDQDLTALGELHELEELQFIQARINGSILAQLPNPKRLKMLYLRQTDIDDAALEPLERMTGLEILNLGETHITDAGLKHVRNLKNLKNLWLDDTSVTDAGLEHLIGLQQLTFVYLHPSYITEAGASSLRAALPKANIVWP